MNGISLAGRFYNASFLAFVALILVAPSTGCRLCCDNEDLAYPAYGGAWQRTRRDSGRVGSLFDPAGARAATLVSRDDPSTVDEIYRSSETERNRNDTDDVDDPGSGDSEGEASEPGPRLGPSDEDLERKSDELKKLELEDIDVIRGNPAPPHLH